MPVPPDKVPSPHVKIVELVVPVAGETMQDPVIGGGPTVTVVDFDALGPAPLEQVRVKVVVRVRVPEDLCRLRGHGVIEDRSGRGVKWRLEWMSGRLRGVGFTW